MVMGSTVRPSKRGIEMAYETLRNRVTGKATTVKVKVSDKGLRNITARQYNAALARLGHGPVAAEHPILVYTDSGREYACIDGTR